MGGRMTFIDGRQSIVHKPESNPFFFPLSGAEQDSIPTVAEPVRRMSFPEENVTIKRLPI